MRAITFSTPGGPEVLQLTEVLIPPLVPNNCWSGCEPRP